jgi:hypothetical protein
MARPNPSTWLPLWLRALDEEIGIAFKISGVAREYFRNTLYEARKASADPRLNDLIMFLPAGGHEDEIWICKKEVELEA